MSNLDTYCRERIEKYPPCMVAWYLMAAYGYYVKDTPILSDGMFDDLAKRLLAAYDDIEHIHKHLITKDDLMAGSLLLKQYPNMTISAYERLVKEELFVKKKA